MWSNKSGPDKVFMLDWNQISDVLCSVGPNTIYFWQMNGTKKKGGFSGNKATNILCVSHDSVGNALCGGQDGNIYKFVSGGGVTNVYPTHKGIIHCIKYIDDVGKKIVLSGGTDLKVVVSSYDNMESIKAITVDGIPRSVDFSKYLLVGMRNGIIAEYAIE
jgi:WD40 repeat protein